MQIRIIKRVWGHKKNVTSFEITLILMYVFLDPLRLSCLCIQNVGAIHDLITYVIIYQFLKD